MSLWDDIVNDPWCWVHTRIAPPSYYEHQHAYANAERADFCTMVYLTRERIGMKAKAIKSWQKWKALYMQSEFLTEQEMRIRLVIAQRYENLNDTTDEKEEQ